MESGEVRAAFIVARPGAFHSLFGQQAQHVLLTPAHEGGGVLLRRVDGSPAWPDTSHPNHGVPPRVEFAAITQESS